MRGLYKSVGRGGWNLRVTLEFCLPQLHSACTCFFPFILPDTIQLKPSSSHPHISESDSWQALQDFQLDLLPFSDTFSGPPPPNTRGIMSKLFPRQTYDLVPPFLPNLFSPASLLIIFTVYTFFFHFGHEIFNRDKPTFPPFSVSLDFVPHSRCSQCPRGRGCQKEFE